MPAPTPYPVFLKIARRPVLIVGGGEVALRKARGLLESGARVTVVSPRFCAGFSESPAIECIQAHYSEKHMEAQGWRLVFAATDRPEVNSQVLKHARALGILCCRCDLPEEGDFSGGATRRIGAVAADGGAASVVLAVSTAGASPALAARIANDAARGVDPKLASLASQMVRWRKMIKKRITQVAARRELLGRLSGEEMEAALRIGGAKATEKLFSTWFARAISGEKPKGGATKGDPRPATRRKSSGMIQHAH